MSQNRSSAVMQQRVEPHDSLDDFPTQPWATRALCEHVLDRRLVTGASVLEPAANRGHMVKPLREYFHAVKASDIFDYGVGFEQRDFLFGMPEVGVDWMITNPPFRLALEFVRRGMDMKAHVAIIVRTSFLEGVERYRVLYSKRPPNIIAQFTERVPMVKGRLTAKGSTATSYCWLVWFRLGGRSQFMWIPPCRKQLEREGDYEAST